MVGRLARGVGVALLWWCVSAQALAQEAPVGTGTIAGIVIDKTTGDPVIEAGVELVGQGKTVRTDLDGRYTVRMPAGTYELRIFAPLYTTVRVPGVKVQPGEVRKVDASLPPVGKAAVEVVEVVAQADRSTEATQLLQRKKAAVVSDTISAEAMKKAPGSDAADVVQRVPAVTVKDGKFIFVRGLNERYSGALLNGSRLPSTEPLRRVVPLNLFPADFLESLSLVKSYTPDLPGDFSGGLADLRLRDFPEKLTAGLSLSAGGNTQSTFQRFGTYPSGGFRDDLGLGAYSRRLPATVPSSPDLLNIFSADQRAAIGRSFADIWTPTSIKAPPNSGMNFNVGTSYGQFGFQFGGIFQNEYFNWLERERQFSQGGPRQTFIQQSDFVRDVSTFATKLGGVLTTAWKPSQNHKLTLRTLTNVNSYDETQSASGSSQNSPGDIVRQTSLQYTQDQLAWGQLAGEHHLPWLEVDWRTALARSREDQPDSRYTTYVGAPGAPPEFSVDSLGGLRVFDTLVQRMTDSAVDFTVPFRTPGLPFTDVWSGLPAKLKFGPAYTYLTYESTQRRFQFTPDGGTLDLADPAEVLFAPENITGLATAGTNFNETTEPTDMFNGTMDIAGGYAMVDVPLVRDTFRLVGGARVEYSLISIDFFDERPDVLADATVNKENTNPLPGLNLIYSPRADMNVRAGWGKSVVRPEFRELSPTQQLAPRGERTIIGNPELVQSEITSFDLRWEWFFTPLELVSLSFFHKKLDSPIEQTVFELASGDPADSWFNAQDGTVTGFEFEGRKKLGFLWKRLDNFTFLTNVTWSTSEVNAAATSDFQQQTSSNRQLQGQAPYIVNAALDYTHPSLGSARLLYNRVAPRIAFVGSFGLPDIFEQTRNTLDAVVLIPLKEHLGVPLTAKIAAENLLNDQVLFTQGPQVQDRYTTGVKFGIGISYTY